MVVDLVDGTFELFRHYYAPGGPAPAPVGDRSAVRGVLGTVLGMLEAGSTHLGVATDHVVESFRNDLWPGYKTGEGLDPALWDQFHPLEEALRALGVTVWAMIEFEADDALAAAAWKAARDPEVQRVNIWTPDKDLAQCVADGRIVQIDRRSGTTRDEAAVIAKFGVPPASIPDWLALVGDTADGFPGLPGWGAKSAATVLARWRHIDRIPERETDWDIPVRGAAKLAATLRDNRDSAFRFRTLATLREDVPVFDDVDELRWKGPSPELDSIAAQIGAPGIAGRASSLAAVRGIPAHHAPPPTTTLEGG